MERIISEQDRIKRAEELISRRRGVISARNIKTNNDKKKIPTLTKLFIKTIVSMCIFGIVYFLSQNNNPVIEKLKPILAYNINFEELYNNNKNTFNSIISAFSDDKEKEENSQNNIDSNNVSVSENVLDNNIVANGVVNEITNEVGIGGGEGKENVNLSQEEQDTLYIKSNFSFIVPVVGTVTSGYGKREPTDIISENHAGVDIGATIGTEIIAAIDGTVEEVSSYGDYGNHLKITNGDVSTLYAHCSTILVNQGDYITQGQKIAEVGNTGRTTGPHLHFEIIRSGRTVDPQAILEL